MYAITNRITFGKLREKSIFMGIAFPIFEKKNITEIDFPAIQLRCLN